jgi:hypothetical protein
MIWKDLKGFEDYYIISEYGDIISKERKSKRILKQGLVDITIKEKTLKSTNITKLNRYKNINLQVNGFKNRYSIHQLVYINFIGELEEDKVINHIDFNRENNHYSNLEAVTQNENIKHFFNEFNKIKFIQNTKKCTKCNLYKDFTEFYSVKRKGYTSNEYRSSCKKCTFEYEKATL